VVVVFEDLHWADQSSLDLLAHLVPLVQSVPLLLVLVGRREPDGPSARLHEVARTRAADRYGEIVLAPLSEADSRRLLDGLVPGDQTLGRLKQAALQRAEGNPFFLEELVRTVIADGGLEWQAGTGQWRVTRAADEIRMPGTLHDVINARVDRLDGDLKQLLKVASVIGRRFLYRVLKAASDAGERVDGDLLRLQALELIYEKHRLPELEYFFKHALIQEVTYGTILSRRRRELHRRVGDCIERLFSDRLEDFYSVLAYHYARAEDWPKAQEYLFKAGDHAGRVAADAEALSLYQSAIEAYERAFGDNWDPVLRSTLERKMGEALFRLGHHEQALACVIAAKARLHPALTALPESVLGIRLAIAREILKRIARSTLARLSPPRPEPPVDPRVLDEIARLGEVTGWIDYFLNPERFFLQALTGLAYFERRPHAIGLIYNHMSIGLICDVIPAFDLAGRHHRRAVEIATGSGQPIALGHAHLGSGIHAHSRGELRTALEEYERTATIFREIGHIRGWGGATMVRAWAYEDLGDFARALTYAESVRLVGDESADPQVRAWGLLRRGVSRRHMGRVDHAAADLELSIGLSRKIPDYAGVVQGLAVLALCHLDRGDLPRARRVIDEANQIRRERNLRGIWVAYAITAAAEVSMAELDASHAGARALRQRAARACRDASRLGKTARHWLPATLRLQGNLKWRERRPAAAEKYWLRSAAVAEAVGTRYQLGLAFAEIGRCFERRHELERAVELLQEAGAEADLARVQRLLAPQPTHRAL
jgi:tetratricopeptide (TPR) repeat protein